VPRGQGRKPGAGRNRGGASDIIGQTLVVDERPREIIGDVRPA
jgi:hypothetical protein